MTIYNEMRAAAERVFNEGVNAPAGIYSLAELAKVGTTCKTAPAGVYFREEYNADKLFYINVDGFECSYPARRAFLLAYKFERLAKVGTKARAVFQRADRSVSHPRRHIRHTAHRRNPESCTPCHPHRLRLAPYLTRFLRTGRRPDQVHRLAVRRL